MGFTNKFVQNESYYFPNFQNRGRRSNKTFTFGNHMLETTMNYIYLGTIISNTGNFKMNEANLNKKAL